MVDITWRSTRDHQQPKSLRAGLGWCVASVPLPSGPNTGSNPGGGRVLNKKKLKKICKSNSIWVKLIDLYLCSCINCLLIFVIGKISHTKCYWNWMKNWSVFKFILFNLPFTIVYSSILLFHLYTILSMYGVLSWCTHLCSTFGNIGLFHRLESDIVVTQFPRYASQKGLDKPV